MKSIPEDIEYLVRSDHRIRVLEALVESDQNRTDLRQLTNASSPTMGRVLAGFEERRWVVRDGAEYRLTELGTYVIDRFYDFCDAMTVERTLRDVWRWLPREMEGFQVGLFSDAVVSYPGPGYPYTPVERLTHLIQQTKRLRGFDSIVFKSINNETVCRAVLNGMELEYVYSPTALEQTFAWNPDRVMEAAAQDNCRVYVHDSLPDGDRCGLGITDDRAGICCHDPVTGALTAVIDTGAPEAREWAIGLFETCRNEATLVELDEITEFVSLGITA